MLTNNTCKYILKSGHRCGRKPLRNSEYCWQHDPLSQKQRKRITLGGIIIFLVSIVGFFADAANLGQTFGIIKPNPTNTIEPAVRIDVDLSDYLRISMPLSGCTTTIDYNSSLDEVWDMVSTESLPDPLVSGNLFITDSAVGLEIGVTGLSTFEWIELDPKVLIRINSYSGQTPNYDFICEEGGFGGQDIFHFQVFVPDHVSPDMVIESERNNEADWFSLSPGERMVYLISLAFSSPGSYDISIGINYEIGGKKQTAWSNQNVKVVFPAVYRQIFWSYDFFSQQINENLRILDCQNAQCNTYEYHP